MLMCEGPALCAHDAQRRGRYRCPMTADDAWAQLGYDRLIGRIERLLPCLMPESRRRVLNELAHTMRHQVTSWRIYHRRILESLDYREPDARLAQARIIEIDELLSGVLSRGLQRVGELHRRYGRGDA
jgi:hypothetical protein